MYQISSIFSRLKQQIGVAGENSGNLNTDQPDYRGLDPGTAPEEDGFLVIGETASERTTVRTATFDKHGHNAPPAYDQQVAGGAISPGADTSQRGLSMFASCTLTPSCQTESKSPSGSDHHHNTHHPAIVGVPFQLNPRLQEKERLSSVLAQLDLHYKHFDWAKYEYDFDFDRASLKELCALSREAKMDTMPCCN